MPAGEGDDSFTREQLLEQPGGPEALWAWERRDDSTWASAYDAERRGSNAWNVRELAAAGNPWARDLIAADYPEPEVTIFLRGDRAFPDWRPQLLG